jgi:hypothetical protein
LYALFFVRYTDPGRPKALRAGVKNSAKREPAAGARDFSPR